MVNTTTLNLNPVKLLIEQLSGSTNVAKQIEEVIRMIVAHANLPAICCDEDKFYLSNQLTFLFELKDMFEETTKPQPIQEFDETLLPEYISMMLESDKERLADLQTVYDSLSTLAQTDSHTRTLEWITDEMVMLKSEISANTRRMAIYKRSK